MIRHFVQHDHLPDYHVTLEDDIVVFTNRGTMMSASPALLEVQIQPLGPETYHEARIVAPGWDGRTLEREWRVWVTEAPHNPDATFIGFCRKVFEKRGRP